MTRKLYLLLAMQIQMAHKKPVTQLRCDTGHGRSIAFTGFIRKGQAFKSPPQPNKRTGNADEGCAFPGRLTAAGIVRGSCGIVAGPTVKRKLDAGRNRDRPIKNRQTDRLDCHVSVYKRRAGSEFNRLWLSKLATRWGFKMPFAARKESYVHRTKLHQV
jgi:hypothetical protein